MALFIHHRSRHAHHSMVFFMCSSYHSKWILRATILLPVLFCSLFRSFALVGNDLQLITKFCSSNSITCRKITKFDWDGSSRVRLRADVECFLWYTIRVYPVSIYLDSFLLHVLSRNTQRLLRNTCMTFGGGESSRHCFSLNCKAGCCLDERESIYLYSGTWAVCVLAHSLLEVCIDVHTFDRRWSST